MADDAGGNATRPPGNIPATGQTAQAAQVNVPVDDIYASLTRRYMRDGRAPMLGNIPMNGYRAVNAEDAVAPQDYVTLAQVQALIATVQGVPTGTMTAMTGTVFPLAWVEANGQTLSRATFPTFWTWVQASGNLAATEGGKTAGQYGPGDGSTTFTVPNLYADGGYFIRPVSSGRNIGTAQADELKAHTHTATFAGTPVPDHAHGYASANNTGGGAAAGSNHPVTSVVSTSTSPAGGHTPSGSVTVVATAGAETRPKNIAYPVLIKT